MLQKESDMLECHFVNLNTIIHEGKQVNVLWQEAESLTFIANGRAYRSEFHINPFHETMLQLRGEIHLYYLTANGEQKMRLLKAGDFLNANVDQARRIVFCGSVITAKLLSTKRCSKSATIP
jgi:hypothetical protein